MIRRSANESSRWRGWWIRRRVTTWAGWDVRVPAPLSDPAVEIEQVWQRVDLEARRLLESSALDSAHAGSLDAFISEAMAPLYRRARQEYNFGLRMLAEFDTTGRAACEEAEAEAHRLTAKAGEHADQVDHLYQEHIGLTRRHTSRSLEDRLEDLRSWRENTFTAIPVDLAGGSEDFRGIAADRATTEVTTAADTAAERPVITGKSLNNHNGALKDAITEGV